MWDEKDMVTITDGFLRKGRKGGLKNHRRSFQKRSEGSGYTETATEPLKFAPVIERQLRRCSRCVLDTTVSDIWFDDAGVCKYCHIHDEMERLHPLENHGGGFAADH
jgi:hypothetical protein